jgi:hypothetical protein
MKKIEREIIYKDDRIIIHKIKGRNEEFVDFLAQKILEYSIHPVVYNFVRTREITPEKAFELAQKRIHYRKDPTKIEGIIAPSKIIKEHILKGVPIYGDCDDKVLFLGSLLVSMGYPVRVVGAYYEPHGKFEKPKINHVYLEMYDDKMKKWIPLEPTAKYTKFGEKALKVIPLYRAEISYREGKFSISREIVPIGKGEQDEFYQRLYSIVSTGRKVFEEMEKTLKEYAEKRGIRYEALQMAMSFNQWIKTPLTWILIGLLGVSFYFNLTKIKREVKI